MNQPQDNDIILRDADGAWLRFRNPRKVLCAWTVDEVLPVLEEAASSGDWAAGFVSYEAAPAFDSALPGRESNRPLAWFGIYDPPEIASLPAREDRKLEWISDIAESRYFQQIEQIKKHIAAGDSYQVNHTIRMRSHVADPWQLFLSHMAASRFSAYIQTGELTICSASPELFFELDGSSITCRPMKGTGCTSEALSASAKDRAENIMIVDMIRNDLGRICVPGTIVADPLHEIESVGDIWQMTSTVRGETAAVIPDIFKALFPCASITGAPKRRTMQIIRELESTPRGVYCGAIGYIAPERKARFSVAIRTAEVDRITGEAVYGVGGGIVWDSQPESEWNECALKAGILGVELDRLPEKLSPQFENFETVAEVRDLGGGVTAPALQNNVVQTIMNDKFLGNSAGRVSRLVHRSLGEGGRVKDTSGFQLLETMLFDNGIAYLNEHIERLTCSAEELGFKLDRNELQLKLASITGERQRLRLLLNREGGIILESFPFPVQKEQLRKVCFAKDPVDSHNPLLFHKTTQRDIYNIAKAAFPDADDVIMWNTDGEVTESTIANVVARMAGELVTPPINCGLLPGTMRAALLNNGDVCERVITRDELRNAEEIFLVNSLRGWMPAEITD